MSLMKKEVLVTLTPNDLNYFDSFCFVQIYFLPSLVIEMEERQSLLKRCLIKNSCMNEY
jgi:hypothetical protein